MKVQIRLHPDDSDMVEIYSKRSNGFMVIWGVVHADMLDSMEVDADDLVTYGSAELKCSAPPEGM